MTKQTGRINGAIALFFSLVLAATFLDLPSAARRKSSEASGEGRPISPAGSLVIDVNTRQPAVGALPVKFVRSPDRTGPEGLGRYLISVNSGYGVQFNAASNIGQQSLGVIDLNAKPAPAVVQNLYFPTPQSVNVGVVFSPRPDADGSYALYVSGGFENKIWIFRFLPASKTPVTPTSPGPNTVVEAQFIDVSGFASAANSPRYNSNYAPVYPTGLAISPDGDTLFVANNLADSLGIIRGLRGTRKLETIPLEGAKFQPSAGLEHFTYPYEVVVTSTHSPVTSEVPRQRTDISRNDPTRKVYVSCWNDSSVAVIDFNNKTRKVSYINVGRHPTSMLWDSIHRRLYVANSDDDSVSMIDSENDREMERISIRLTEEPRLGNSPEGIALDRSGTSLFVTNAHSNSLAIVTLASSSLENLGRGDKLEQRNSTDRQVSHVRGFIPTGQYPSAVAEVAQTIFIGNGKGTGFQNSSLVVDNSGRLPNKPNDRFPAGTARRSGQGGQYIVSLMSGNISAVTAPDDLSLARYTQEVMRNNGLLGPRQIRLFPGRSPIRHVIYVIKENRTYDQVFGDIEKSGDGARADGDATLAIFGSKEAAARPDETRQDITPNQHALALRFGLFDRFFVNSEASPDGHNWSTAAFSSDYVDKAFRWNYSRRGRSYDFEGFNRLPNYEPMRGAPPIFGPSVDAEEVANFLRKYIPYLNGSHDVGEPQSLYLWDAAARASLTYRNYGEFIATLSKADVAAIGSNRSKTYPDLSPTVSSFPTKKSLEGHYSSSFRNFDLDTPDAMTIDSYRRAREAGTSAFVNSSHAETRFRGNSRIGAWLEEFRGFVNDLQAGRGDHLPNLSIMRLPNDHTAGMGARRPTPQFFVADNDYAVGLLVEGVSSSPYWKDTAIFVVEDDAQDGADHVDAHRAVALVISAFNRPGLLVHEFHSTVSLIRTIELLLGIAPMNQLDATATPMDIFRAEPDLTPYRAQLPNITLDNLTNPPARDGVAAQWIRRTEEQDLAHADMADADVLNRIIWFSVKGATQMPAINRLPAFDAMRLGLKEGKEEIVASSRPKD